MIPLLGRDAVRAIDRDAVERVGLPSLVLMENAGSGACRVLFDRYGDALDRVVVLGGPGQNGGDGWVVARHLANAGVVPIVALAGSRAKVKGDAATNLGVLEALGIAVHELGSPSAAAAAPFLERATCVVDGLFGTGLDRPIEGGLAEIIGAVNATFAPVLALDVPSGIDADTGAVLGAAIDADTTVTFAAHKRGLHQHPGVDHAGHVVLVSIGVPGPSEDAPAQIFDPVDVARVVADRAVDAHKGSAGRVFVFAGSPGKTGAAVLAGTGALRAGAGLVTIAPRAAALAALERKVVELMTEALPDDAERAVDAAVALAPRMDAAVVGPGLGVDPDGVAIALGLAARLPIPTVLDADALTALAGAGLESIRDAAGARILTPHPGEAARLLGCSTADVQRDRYAAATAIAARSNAVAVLKGARTVVAAPDGRLRVCRRGVAALATAGTGDVLSGVTAALAAHHDSLEAAIVAVVLHALAGEIAADSDRGLLAHEVADAIPRALTRARDGGPA